MSRLRSLLSIASKRKLTSNWFKQEISFTRRGPKAGQFQTSTVPLRTKPSRFLSSAVQCQLDSRAASPETNE